MKALCISGGGSKGAFGGGIVEYLREIGNDWDLYGGTSTGSLITPMVACDKIDKLKIAYTNIQPSDIFSLSPFRVIKKKNGIIRFGINHFVIAYNLIWKVVNLWVIHLI